MSSEYQPHDDDQSGRSPATVPLDQLPTVKFTDKGYRVAKHIAAARILSYESIDGEAAYGNQSDFDAHLTGILGEIAVATSLDGTFDDGVYIYGDDGFDVKLWGDYTGDVKTTETDLELPDLIVRSNPRPTADLYILCHRIDELTIRMIGYTDLETVLEKEPERFPGTRLNHIVPPEELWMLPR